MEILSEKPFSYDFECRDCGSSLRASASDLKTGMFGANYGGETPNREFYVECPVCGAHRVVDRKLVPVKTKREVEGQ